MGSCLSLAVRKKKKKKTVALPEIPEELLIDILVRLPVKSLMRYKCVSKIWLSLITSTYLTNLFLKSSSSRRLFAYVVDEVDQHKLNSEYALLTSSSSSSHDDHSVSVIDQDMTMPGIGGYLVNAVHGLMCFRIERRVRICNIHTRQVVEFPIIRPELGRYYNVWNCFGHDSVHDKYKVLSLVWEVNEERSVVRSEHHVLVLGAGASWKKTQCHIPHRPYRTFSANVFINNVLYYGAWTDDNRRVLMSFDLSSEEFKLIELPNIPYFRNLNLYRTTLMNYKGRVAVFDCGGFSTEPRVGFWVIEDADKSLWSDKETIVLPVSPTSFDLTGGYQWMILIGGWLTKAPLTPNQPTRFSIYDLERYEITRMIEINSSLLSFKKNSFLVSTLWYDVENIMYLET